MTQPTDADPHMLLRDEVHDLITGYLQRLPGATDAYTQDAVYHHTMKHVESLLWLVAIAMQDVGIPSAMRIQVLRLALYGSAPSTKEADARAAELRARIEAMDRQAPRASRIDTTLAQLDDILGPYGGGKEWR